MLNNFELQLPNRSKNWIPLTFIGVVENLNGTLFAQFIHPLSEILKRRGIRIAKPAEDFWAEARNSLKFHF